VNLKLMRLKSGEDIVVELLDGKESQQHITVKNPAMLVPVGDGKTNLQMGLMPWMPFSEAREFDLPREWVLLTTEPAQEIVNNYNQVFGSGIVVPQVNTAALLNE